MEEKDISNIAGAVSRELAKLNSEKPTENGEKIVEEGFNCPECGSPVKGMTPFCPTCGCPLEWEA